MTPAGEATHGHAFGYACGFAMAIGASLAFASARAGILGGLGADDMIFARFVVAGCAMLPFVAVWGFRTLGGIGWPRGLALLATGGPLFAILQTGGYAFAPLAHGAVIAPSSVTIVSTIVAGLTLGERLTRAHVAGAVVVVAGILMIGWQGIADGGHGDRTWVGDLLFFASGVLWAAFTVLLRHWRIDALRATGVVCVLAFFVVVPVYLLHRGSDHLMALPFAPLAFQGLTQGFVQAIFTMLAYSRAVAILGVSRAVLFPASVPAFSMLIGIPAIGEIPTTLQIAGLALVSAGLALAIGVVGRLRRVAAGTT
ncbi:MAG: EamA family transporter [Alphaproteobacteria bacterium]|nr:EamA family transporter [Alphaproteobacteria bacterium]